LVDLFSTTETSKGAFSPKTRGGADMGGQRRRR